MNPLNLRDTDPQPTILVVDDSPLVLTAQSHLIKRLGYSVYTAARADHALQHIALYAIDLVFTDIHMPHVRGDDLATLIRRRLPKLPIIAVTNATQTELQHIEKKNFNAILQKPLTGEQIQQVMKKWGVHLSMAE